MVIIRTPYRISFFGGGTDYPAWYQEHGGAVLATTIDKYCYLTCRYLPPYFEHKYRVVYSRIETVRHFSEIEHPSVRAILEWADCHEGLEIHHDGDVPARSGLGSSSSFTVGLVHALHALRGRQVAKEELAKSALHIEQKIIKEHVGSQDQILASYGGFNRVDFMPAEHGFQINPLIMSKDRLQELENHLLLCFTGQSRIASEVAKSKIDNFKARINELKQIRAMVEEASQILQNTNLPIEAFGRLLHQSWLCKRSLSDKVSTPHIDSLYETALKAGAIGGKILGAGGGGFLLLFVQPEHQQKVREQLKDLIHIPFRFENSGSRVVLYQPNGLN